MKKNDRKIFFLLALLLVICLPTKANASKIEDIKMNEVAGGMNIEIILDKEMSYKQSNKDNPSAVVLDIQRLEVDDEMIAGKSIVKEIKVSQTARKPIFIGRIFIEFTKAPLKVEVKKAGKSIIVSIAANAPSESRVVSPPANEEELNKAVEERLKEETEKEKAKLEAGKKEKEEGETKVREVAEKEKKVKETFRVEGAKLKKGSESVPMAQKATPEKKPVMETTTATRKQEGENWKEKYEAVEKEKLEASAAAEKEKKARLNAEKAIAKLDAEISALKKQHGEIEKKKLEAEAAAEKEKKARLNAEKAIAKLDKRIAELVKAEITSEKPARTSTGETLGWLPVTTGAEVFFEFAEAAITPAAQKTLDKLIGIMKIFTDNKILLEGHTDSVGSQKVNLNLSRERVQAILKYLVKNGVDGQRISTEAYAFNKPIATNATSGGRAQNRRVEITILK
jgi:outer membrane protein OmpA-like peptidoglycan-associated protein